MKIAFLCKNFRAVDRGAEVFVAEVSSRLALLGHTVQVFPWAKHLSEFLPQVVISTNGRADVIRARVWCLTHRAKLVIPGQSGPGLDDRINLLTFPHTFVALTHHQQSWAKSANPLVPTIVIPNGVDLAKFNPQVTPFKTKLPPPVVLCVAALTVDKRQDLTLKAAAKLGVSVLLVGRGDREQAIRSLGEHLLKDRFHHISLPHSQVPSVYTCANVFTYPTVPWEPFGIVLLEAMASGLPVVATNDPIRREIIGPAGLFVDPQDTDAYAATLWKAVRTDWQHAPRAQAELFSWTIVANKYHQLCQSLTSLS